MLRILILVLILGCTHLPFCYGQQENPNKGVRVSLGYDIWYAMWDVYVPDPEYVEFHDYDIDPTIINGISITASYRKGGAGSWDLLAGAYGDFFLEEQDKDVKNKVNFFQGLLSYGITGSNQLLTQIQWARFKGELVGQYAFETDWVKADLLAMTDAGYDRTDYSFGLGLRYTQYSMPLEFSVHEDINGESVKTGSFVADIETQGLAIVGKILDPLTLGHDDGNWYFVNGDLAFGVSKVEAEELNDNVYGFQFNSQLEGGVKHGFNIGKGLIGLKLGYRVFFDSQILSEWRDKDGQTNSGTIRNFFHGPFFMLIGAF